MMAFLSDVYNEGMIIVYSAMRWNFNIVLEIMIRLEHREIVMHANKRNETEVSQLINQMQ